MNNTVDAPDAGQDTDEAIHGVDLEAFLNNEMGSNEFITALEGEAELVDEALGKEDLNAGKEDKPLEDPTPKEDPPEKYSQALAKLNDQRQQLEKEKAEVATFRKAKARVEAASELFEEEPVEFAKQLVSAFYETEDQDKIEQGLTHLYQALLAHSLGDGAPEALRPDKKTVKVERELKELKKKLEYKEQEEQRTLQERQQLEAFHSDIKTIQDAIAPRAEELEYLMAEGDHGLETVYIMAINGTPLDKAISDVNAHFAQEFQNKYSKLLAKKASTPNQGQAANKTKVKPNAKSLSNADTAPASKPDSYLLNDEEDWKASAKLIRLT